MARKAQADDIDIGGLSAGDLVRYVGAIRDRPGRKGRREELETELRGRGTPTLGDLAHRRQEIADERARFGLDPLTDVGLTNVARRALNTTEEDDAA